MQFSKYAVEAAQSGAAANAAGKRWTLATSSGIVGPRGKAEPAPIKRQYSGINTVE